MNENRCFNAADIFGENVFNDKVMRERLPKKTYQKLKEFENDLHKHVHLENNILFPKATALFSS